MRVIGQAVIFFTTLMCGSAGAQDVNFCGGTFGTALSSSSWPEGEVEGTRELRERLNLCGKKYSFPIEILLSVNQLSIKGQNALGYQISADDITNDSFTIKLMSFPGSEIDMITVTWMAIPVYSGVEN